ncbi:MAG: hypothetical protein G5Z43_000384 [Caldisphaeraceae archaeon]|nr:hypothetical protein [Caldisphaeraceae archaeon]
MNEIDGKAEIVNKWRPDPDKKEQGVKELLEMTYRIVLVLQQKAVQHKYNTL